MLMLYLIQLFSILIMVIPILILYISLGIKNIYFKLPNLKNNFIHPYIWSIFKWLIIGIIIYLIVEWFNYNIVVIEDPNYKNDGIIYVQNEEAEYNLYDYDRESVYIQNDDGIISQKELKLFETIDHVYITFMQSLLPYEFEFYINTKPIIPLENSYALSKHVLSKDSISNCFLSYNYPLNKSFMDIINIKYKLYHLFVDKGKILDILLLLKNSPNLTRAQKIYLLEKLTLVINTQFKPLMEQYYKYPKNLKDFIPNIIKNFSIFKKS